MSLCRLWQEEAREKLTSVYSWFTEGFSTTEVLHLPLAVQAGLDQLGKHGSLITKEVGSNLRLATVLTKYAASP